MTENILQLIVNKDLVKIKSLPKTKFNKEHLINALYHLQFAISTYLHEECDVKLSIEDIDLLAGEQRFYIIDLEDFKYLYNKFLIFQSDKKHFLQQVVWKGNLDIIKFVYNDCYEFSYYTLPYASMNNLDVVKFIISVQNDISQFEYYSGLSHAKNKKIYLYIYYRIFKSGNCNIFLIMIIMAMIGMILFATLVFLSFLD